MELTGKPVMQVNTKNVQPNQNENNQVIQANSFRRNAKNQANVVSSHVNNKKTKTKETKLMTKKVFQQNKNIINSEKSQIQKKTVKSALKKNEDIKSVSLTRRNGSLSTIDNALNSVSPNNIEKKSQKSVTIKPEALPSNENIPNLNIDVHAKSSTSSRNFLKNDEKRNLIISTPNFEE